MTKAYQIDTLRNFETFGAKVCKLQVWGHFAGVPLMLNYPQCSSTPFYYSFYFFYYSCWCPPSCICFRAHPGYPAPAPPLSSCSKKPDSNPDKKFTTWDAGTRVSSSKPKNDSKPKALATKMRRSPTWYQCSISSFIAPTLKCDTEIFSKTPSNPQKSFFYIWDRKFKKNWLQNSKKNVSLAP